MFPTASIVAAAIAVSGGGQDLGPLPTRNHRAVALAFLRFEPRRGVLPEGAEETSVSWTTANDLRALARGNSLVLEDYEVSRLAFAWRRGVGHNTDLALELPLVARGGGGLDPLIDWWHRNLLHWTSTLREATPDGRSRIALPGSPRFGSTAGLGDASLTVGRAWGPNATVRFGVKVPTGDSGRLLGSGSADVGVSVDAHRALGNGWSVHAQAALIAQGASDFVEGVRGWADQEALALVYAPNTRDRWIVQWQSERAPVSTGVPGADATHRLVTLGYRRILDAHRTLDLLLSEDRDLFNSGWPEGANVGPDLSVGIRLSWRR